MTAVPKKKLTVAEYLAIEKAAEFKSEFYDGEMFAMAGASREHNALHNNLVIDIGSRLDGSPCRTYSSDQRVKVQSTGLYTYPDVVIVCGGAMYDPEDRDSLINPAAVVEILSPSTERYDRGTKFLHYQSIPSLREFILVSQSAMLIQSFVRQPNETWTLTTFSGQDAVLELSVAPVRVPLARLYRDVELSPPPTLHPVRE